MSNEFLGDVRRSADKIVIVDNAPISERFWTKGDKSRIRNNQIRLGGCWFPFDGRYKVRD